MVADQRLKDVKLKDIKEEIKSDGAILSIDTEKADAKHSLNMVVSWKVLLALANKNLALTVTLFVFKSELQDFIYNFSYQDDLNNKGDIKIGKYAFEINDEYTNVKFDLGALKAKSSVEDVKKDLQIKRTMR